MKVFDFPLAPNPKKLRVYLAEKGIALPIEPVDAVSGKNARRSSSPRTRSAACRSSSSTTAPASPSRSRSSSTSRSCTQSPT